jgi:hypothetical protein
MRIISHRTIPVPVGSNPTLDCHPLGAFGALISAASVGAGAQPEVTESGPTGFPTRLLFKTVNDRILNYVPYNYIITPLPGGYLTFDPGINVDAVFTLILFDAPPTPQGTWLVHDTQDTLLGGGTNNHQIDWGIATDFTLTLLCSNGATVLFNHGAQSEAPYARLPILTLPVGNQTGGVYTDHVYTRYADYNLTNPDPLNPTQINVKLRARIHSL